ncbi:hypothetical protein LUA82_01135 [Neoehrlichia mikurensis]|uniref:Uncharacterized protein n=1 Tax=Neoehrlichia mikurensis TaxID=89586 RepID=A0A9Q9BSU9_9RICK|nr:hypothetical protein [Neoehrlichia mikurensis]UTO55675.1 hypothetical protein LUA82_01135 [Neoehrlichia mikurensis]UTO56593.1 hypothetical protein LUA81_01125 [Neoehrlichia mikurensis]
MLYKGQQIDPQKVHIAKEIVKIPESELPSFQLTMNDIRRTLMTLKYGCKLLSVNHN